ncbi:trafficking kinesin-binding protein 1 [Ditylenchus destructor]|nr:trafficking kinesin-binding protein 1 [Ditylenchus destructor]
MQGDRFSGEMNPAATNKFECVIGELLSERWSRPSNAASVSRRFVRPMSRDVSSHRKKSAVPMSSTAVHNSVDYGDIQPESISSILHALEEKEKDLELAAKIGNSLLEQNKELQESNEAIHQLQYQLKQRSSLFHAIADLDDEEERAAGSFTGYLGTSDRTRELESRVKSLENENQRLKGKASKLEDHAIAVEKRERERIKDYLGQLERANLKIGRLQEQIIDKSKECTTQAEETERLMKEINQRKCREKAERYLDVMGMLRETEDELRGHRQQAALYRTNSADSLYDSLASELEASDSGCYNTPMFSARCESQQSSSQNPPDLGLQLSDLEQCHSREESSEEIEIEGLPSTSPGASYDVPTRALVNAVRSASARAPVTRSMSADLSSENETGPCSSARWPTNFQEVSGEVSTPLAEEIMSFSSISYQSTTSIGTIIPAAGQIESPRKRCDSAGTISTPCEPELSKEVSCSGKEDENQHDRNGKVYRDISCSPISFQPQSPSLQKPSTPKIVRRPAVMQRQQISSVSAKRADPAIPSTSHSLSNYTGPKLGEPGSIRRLNLKKQSPVVVSTTSDDNQNCNCCRKIERQYEEFRRQRGLPPSKFYPAIEHRNDDIKRTDDVGGEQNGSRNDEVLFGCSSIFGHRKAFEESRGCWKRALGTVHIARPTTLGIGPEGNDGIISRNINNAVSRTAFPKSESCSRLDGVIHRLSQPLCLSRPETSLSQCQEHSVPSLSQIKLNGINLMRPGSIPSIFLLKHHVPRRRAAPLTNLDIGNHVGGLRNSRGTSPIADFSSTEILGLNNVSTGSNAKPVGIIQRFGGQIT